MAVEVKNVVEIFVDQYLDKTLDSIPGVCRCDGREGYPPLSFTGGRGEHESAAADLRTTGDPAAGGQSVLGRGSPGDRVRHL